MISNFKIPEGLTGDGVVVGVCDSRCDLSHPLLAGRRMSHRCFLTGRHSQIYDRHGTHVVGIIARVASGCEFAIAETAFLGNGRYPELAEALEWLESSGANVINMSLSYGRDEPKIREVLSRMASCGTVICASCGEHPGMFPSSYEFVVSVGSHFCSPDADVYAPRNFRSCVPGGGEAMMGGTSMSCACMSAVAAMYVQGGGLGRDGFLEWLKKKAGDHASPANVSRRTVFVR